MSRRAWKLRLGVFAGVAVIALVANPELRALLLFTDAIGLEVAVALLATQCRASSPFLRAASEPIVAALCRLAARVGRASLRALPGVLHGHGKVVATLLGPIVWTMTFGLQCRIGTPTR